MALRLRSSKVTIGMLKPEQIARFRKKLMAKRRAIEARTWKSGPWTVAELRNEVIHAKRQANDRALKVWIQAWKLAVW